MKNKKPNVKKAKSLKVKEVFKSLSGKTYESKEVYLEEKLKRANTKFTKGFKLIESKIKIKKNRISINLLEEIKEGLSPDLITNRNKGFLGLIPYGEKYRIENTVIKNLPKKNKSNGTSDLITKFDLVRI